MRTLTAISLTLIAALAAAQQHPQVRVNYLNVCAPGEPEQKEMAAALARIPRRPAFAHDFEVARGRTTASEGAVARWVRIRREFPSETPFSNAQYSFSVEEKGVMQTLVLLFRNPKDVMQVAVEQSSAVGSADALGAEPEATRIRLERFGKPSVVLARCQNADQSAYEPLFKAATEILSGYRTQMNVRRTVAADLPKLQAAPQPAAAHRKK